MPPRAQNRSTVSGRSFTPDVTKAQLEAYLSQGSRVESGIFAPAIGLRPFGNDNGDDLTHFTHGQVTWAALDGSYGFWTLYGLFCTFEAYVYGTISYAAGINTQAPSFYLPFQPASIGWWYYPYIGSAYDEWATDPTLPVQLAVQDGSDADTDPATVDFDPFNHAQLTTIPTAGGSGTALTLAQAWGATGGGVSMYVRGTYMVAPGTTGRDLIETV